MPERFPSTFGTAIGVALTSTAMWLAMGWAVTPLVIALIGSYLLWLSRDRWPIGRALGIAYGTAIAVQCVHLLEEYRTGFYRVFPPVFGAEPWEAGRFLVFNAAWLVVFLIGGIGLIAKRRPAVLIALFLAVGGGLGNGIGHAALALRAGGYFPGMYTAPLALVTGGTLLALLLRPTTRVDDA